MLFPVRQLIQGRPKPLCVTRKTSVHDALALMIQHDYSQLPVLSDNGKLLGFVSEQSIVKSYFHTGGNVALMPLLVDHCLEDAQQISADRDIFEALDLLKNDYAIVVVEKTEPLAILTNYDTAHFFRDFSEGLMLVEDIEVSLRNLIDDAFPQPKALASAFAKAFGPAQGEGTLETPAIDHLTFADIMKVINKNWPAFEKILGEKMMFINVMEPIREIRNQLAHFRGRLEPVQHDTLLNGRHWLNVRLSNFAESKRLEQDADKKVSPPAAAPGLKNYLLQQPALVDIVQLSFSEIETINGERLPDLSASYSSWWGNDLQTHVHSAAWMKAGYQIKEVDLATKMVKFRKSKNPLYQMFFMDLLDRAKKAHPGVIGVNRVYPTNNLWFTSVRPGYSFYWTFSGKSTFSIDLYLELTTKEDNKRVFDLLFALRSEIEGATGLSFIWDRLDQRKGSWIGYVQPAQIIDPPEKLEELKKTMVEKTYQFINGIRPFIDQINSAQFQ